MKLPFAGAEAFLVERGRVAALELDAERTQFFEDWLAQRYRRDEEDADAPAHLALFPVVHTGRDELAGLLRFPVEVEWIRGAELFSPPTFEARSAGRYPEPPTALKLGPTARDPEETLPFFVDTSLLRRELRVDGEDLESFFASLRARRELSPLQMVQATCALLETPQNEPTQGALAEKIQDGSASAWLARLQRAVLVRLAEARSRARVYPIALIVSSQLSRATWHVQRDLEEALSRVSARTLPPESPLAAYLGAGSSAGTVRACLGRWPSAPLTSSQRRAVEYAFSTPFAAVQGPPGTGKTTLILNAIVHQLIENLWPVCNGAVPRETVLVVTSTNNRAVDNVMAPLCAGELAELPLALRLGNREVTGSVTVRTLERVLEWLSRQPAPSEAEWLEARKNFKTRYDTIQAGLGPWRSLHAQLAELTALQERKALECPKASLASATSSCETNLAALTDGATPTAADAPWRQQPGEARVEVGRALKALAALSRSCEAGGTALAKVNRGVRRFRSKNLPPLQLALGVELAFAAPTQTDADQQVALWEERCEQLFSRLLDVEGALAELAAARVGLARGRKLEAEIEALTRTLGRAASDRAALEELEERLDARLGPEYQALYAAALALRGCWLRQRRGEVEIALRAAIAQCQRTRSLKPLFQAEHGAGAWLRRIFPCFGCTLLSLGNAFPAESGACARVIIDEAGQCHPAYAVSALLRAGSALVIGDVHQLEPVIGLGLDDERRIRKSLKLAARESSLEPYRVYDESGHSAQSLADRAAPGRPSLSDHFRCQPEIIALCEAWCDYGMRVNTPRASLVARVPALRAPVLFLPVSGEQERFAGSWENRAERDELLAWIRHLLAHGVPARDLAVITPYRGQFEGVFHALRAEGFPLEAAHDELEDATQLEFQRDGGLAVGTVHRFQGGERRVVLLSTTVTRASSLGFLNDRVHLLNVAASRAKEHLLVFGHEPTLCAGKHTRVLVRDIPRLLPFAQPGPSGIRAR